MKATISYKDAIEGLNLEIQSMVEKTGKQSKDALNQIGAAVKRNVQTAAPVSEREYYYTDGQKKRNTHIKDDVVYKVKNSRKADSRYVSVSGGPDTWRKWHLADEGHVTQNGRFVPGNGFTEKAVVMSESEIDEIINNMIGEIVQ